MTDILTTAIEILTALSRSHSGRLEEHYAFICDAHNRIDAVIAAQHLQHQVNSDAITLLHALMERIEELETKVERLQGMVMGPRGL